MSNRVPQLFDSVVVMDLDGRQASALVTGLPQPGNPGGNVLVRPVQGLRLNWSVALRCSASPQPGCWSWPVAKTNPLAAHPKAPSRGVRVLVCRNNDLLKATVTGVDDVGNPHSPIVAAIDGEYAGGLPLERRYVYADSPPREGCWCW